MPFPGVGLNPTENVYVIRSAEDLPDELDEYVFYNLQYDPGQGVGLYYCPDGINLIPVYVEGWEDLTADLSAGKAVGANAPTWATFRSGISAYSFHQNTMNEMWITFHVKHDYKVGSNGYLHIHWAPNTTSTGTVRWGFEYSVARGHDQEAFPAPTTVYVNHTIATNKQYQHIITEISDVQAFDLLETDSLVLCRIFRDAGNAADTFPDPVFGLTADIHYQADKQFTPNKSPPFFS